MAFGFDRFGRIRNLGFSRGGDDLDYSDDFFDFRFSGFNFPEVDVKDDGDDLVISLDLPGVDKKEIRLHVEAEKIEVRAERSENFENDEDYYISERKYRGFYRMVRLPVKIIPERVKAKYADDVLTVSAPKAKVEESQIDIE